ncbi:MAG: UxaA family hydrolase [Bryobacterales bacterium]|nr:UxaA family hydrolase [Bryobacterales bacterium]
MKKCFQIHADDNAATLLEDCDGGGVEVIGGSPAGVTLVEPIRLGHKVALCDIKPGAAIIKFGIPIGVATQPIRAGEWIHLHNCRSRVDERSSTLDVETGAPTDVVYE